jgi:hypothetical protein
VLQRLSVLQRISVLQRLSVRVYPSRCLSHANVLFLSSGEWLKFFFGARYKLLCLSHTNVFCLAHANVLLPPERDTAPPPLHSMMGVGRWGGQSVTPPHTPPMPLQCICGPVPAQLLGIRFFFFVMAFLAGVLAFLAGVKSHPRIGRVSVHTKRICIYE